MATTPPKPTPKPQASTTARARNFLAYGFIISVALHLILGPFISFKPTQTKEDAPQKVTVVRVPTPPPTPPPTPKPSPTPPPTPPPKQTPPPQTPAPTQPKIKINTLKTSSKSSGPSEAANRYTTGSTQGAPSGEGTGKPVAAPANTPAPATPAPTPVPTPTPLACAHPNVQATTIRAADPEMPAMAQQQGVSGTVQVQVSLDANSRIVGAKIFSSPSSLLNSAAIAAARASTFQTEISNCKPEAADYLFAVEFDSQ
ncbi:MAG: TonB family protein [Vulcanimicrobiaceae bacterium]|jgi:TonB family protein